jgi:hypothetical protein
MGDVPQVWCPVLVNTEARTNTYMLRGEGGMISWTPEFEKADKFPTYRSAKRALARYRKRFGDQQGPTTLLRMDGSS